MPKGKGYGGKGSPKLKSIARDGEQGGGIESGTCHKEKIGNENLGQGTSDGSMSSGAKPAGLGPKTKVSRGQVIW